LILTAGDISFPIRDAHSGQRVGGFGRQRFGQKHKFVSYILQVSRMSITTVTAPLETRLCVHKFNCLGSDRSREAYTVPGLRLKCGEGCLYGDIDGFSDPEYISVYFAGFFFTTVSFSVITSCLYFLPSGSCLYIHTHTPPLDFSLYSLCPLFPS
jgi:hypothetical protein